MMNLASTKDHTYSVSSGDIIPNDIHMKEWTKFDQIVTTFLSEQKVPGASVAVSHFGKILYRQGYGIAGASRRVHCNSVFRIASISKPITATLLMKVFEQYSLPLDTRVFGKNGILKKYRTRDKRMRQITVRHLLQHSAGWDRDQADDVVFARPQCVRIENPDSSAYNHALISYALRRKLQFSPGVRHAYSNFGFLVLGEVIEAVCGQSFDVCISEFLSQAGISNIKVGKSSRADWNSAEVEYYNNRLPGIVDSIYPDLGEVLPQYGGMALESSGAYGGLVSDTISLLQFLYSFGLQSSPKEVSVANVFSKVDPSSSTCDHSSFSRTAGTHEKKNCDMKDSDGMQFNFCPDSYNLNLSKEQMAFNDLLQFSISDHLDSDGEGIVKNFKSCCDKAISLPNVPECACEVSVYTQELPIMESMSNTYNTSDTHEAEDTLKTALHSKHSHLVSHCSNLHGEDINLNSVPLLTTEQVKQCLEKPSFEAGHDWYGLGWDIQDDGKSWGHTGGMEGTCGTLFHHSSGLDWVFLLNAWAVDWDLNGVIKCALCSVPELRVFDCQSNFLQHRPGIHICSQDQSQIILVGVKMCSVMEIVPDMQSQGYFATWISVMFQDVCLISNIQQVNSELKQSISHQQLELNHLEVKYIVIFEKCKHKCDYVILLDQASHALDAVIEEYDKLDYTVSFVDSYYINSELKFSVILRKHKNHKNILTYFASRASDYVKQAKRLVHSHDFLLQSVTETKKEELFVSAVLVQKPDKGKSIYWVQISPESFLVELNRQVGKSNGLRYAKFYTASGKPWVSGCWSASISGKCYHRTTLSKYGLLPELLEAAAQNLTLRCLSEYTEEDGSIYYAAFWHVD